MRDLDFGRYEALTFDCYGTLIDWETGLLAAYHDALVDQVLPPDEILLEAHARHEAELEAGPYRSYREILEECLRRLAAEARLAPPDDDAATRFGGSVVDWPPFPDSTGALERLHERFRLGIITNCDDDLFAGSGRRLGIDFDWVVTAEQVGAYKPSHRNFELAFDRLSVPPDRILHVAQSLYHDHVPAADLGLDSVWIDRRHDRDGFGATPPAQARPALAVPDLATLAELAAA